MTQNELLQRLKEHKPIIINYGKGILTDEDVKDYATWDDEIQKYRDDTGIWSTELLLEIIKGNVENTKIEIGE